MTLAELDQIDESTANEEAEKIERLRIQERITQRQYLPPSLSPLPTLLLYTGSSDSAMVAWRVFYWRGFVLLWTSRTTEQTQEQGQVGAETASRQSRYRGRLSLLSSPSQRFCSPLLRGTDPAGHIRADQDQRPAPEKANVCAQPAAGSDGKHIKLTAWCRSLDDDDEDADLDHMDDEELKQALDELEKEEGPRVTKVRVHSYRNGLCRYLIIRSRVWRPHRV